MKAVLISIQPKWCELIASGKKTIEVRKTRPKLETPFKCYIYQTMTGYVSKSKENDILVPTTYGKVIGEFVCDEIIDGSAGPQHWIYICENSALSCQQIYSYCGEDAGGNVKYCWGWHISDLVIYDKPKELSEYKGRKLVWRGNNHVHAYEQIKRPPQSWCYVEEQ